MVRNTEVSLCGVKLKNPVMPASGVYGFGGEYLDFYDPNILGALVLTGTTARPRSGGPAPRVAECTSGMLSSAGLQNPGIDAVIKEELPMLREFYHGPVVANIGGFSAEEYALCCGKIDGLVDIIEINLSCPGGEGGGVCFGADPELACEATRAAKAAARKTPVFAKLDPNVADITEIALACQEAGADGLCLINPLLGMRVDVRTRKPVLAGKTGGFSGRAIFPVALRMVYQVSRAVKIPIIGAGGISKAEDVIEMMMAGAAAVQVGSENLRDPMACLRIIEELPVLMEKLDIENLVDIINAAE